MDAGFFFKRGVPKVIVNYEGTPNSCFAMEKVHFSPIKIDGIPHPPLVSLKKIHTKYRIRENHPFLKRIEFNGQDIYLSLL